MVCLQNVPSGTIVSFYSFVVKENQFEGLFVYRDYFHCQLNAGNYGFDGLLLSFGNVFRIFLLHVNP